GGVAVDVRDDGEGTHGRHVGHAAAGLVEEEVGQLGGDRSGHAGTTERAAQAEPTEGAGGEEVGEVLLGVAGGGIGGERRAGVGGGHDEVDLLERGGHRLVGFHPHVFGSGGGGEVVEGLRQEKA